MSSKGSVRIYGLIGYPLEHSFSAAWFAEQFSQRNITDAEYHSFPLSNISKLSKLLADERLMGFNVTAPYKRAVIRFLSELDHTAAEIGAVNCVVRCGSGWKGYNVDWIGFSNSLTEILHEERPNALILGSGGAAAAAAYGLRQLDIKYVTVSRAKTEKGFIRYSDLDKTIMDSHPLIVNATPLGTYPDTQSCAPIPYALLTSAHILYDMVYNPPLSEFLRRGQKVGAKIMNGRRMLEIQAQKSWELFEIQSKTKK